MDSAFETVERQAAVIKMQADIINELFQLLGQHIAAEEMDQLPCVQKINEAARLLN